MRRTKGFILTFILLISFFSLWGCRKEQVAEIGDAGKDFTLPTLDGQMIGLSQFKGRKVFLLFWTQGCVFCQTRNIILVNDIYLKGQRADLVVLAINIAESKGDVSEFVKQKGLLFPILLDKDGSVSRKKYNVYIVPTLFIIDKNGFIKEKVYGYLTEQTLLELVEPYLR